MKDKASIKKRFYVAVAVLLAAAFTGYSIVQAQSSPISLDSPVSFPVDI